MLSFMCRDTRSSVTHPLLSVTVHANRYSMVCKAVASICVYVHAIGTVWFVKLLLLFVSMFMQSVRYGL